MCVMEAELQVRVCSFMLILVPAVALPIQLSANSLRKQQRMARCLDLCTHVGTRKALWLLA